MRLLLTFFFIFSHLLADSQEGEIWIIEQEFVKLGKKEIYEATKKKWLADFEKFMAKEIPSIFCFEEGGDNEYFYLIPLSNFAQIDTYYRQQREFNRKGAQTLNSLLNFKVFTIHQYKAECSYCPSSPDMFATPKVDYEVYTLVSGGEEVFEQMLAQKAAKAVKKKSKACWRVWKMVFGAEIPKYVIAHFTKEEESIEPQLIDPSLSDIIRRKQQGKAVIKPVLSTSRS